tara:strand:+ start:2928 stop:4037 length:1110 start_codon:yes stop_codon:yes gene_type:complete
MAYTDIDDPSAFFQTTLYTGNGGNGHVITHTGNSDLQADMVWVKMRSAAYPPVVYDTNRRPSGTPFSGSLYLLTVGNNYGTGAENTGAYGPTAIGSDSVTMNSYDTINKSSETFVAWNWKANGGSTTTLSNTGPDSVVQVNSDAGFSIGTYTGNGSNSNVKHGLGETPDMLIVKRRTGGTGAWAVWHKDLTTGYWLRLDDTMAQASGVWDGLDPTSEKFFITGGSSNVNISGSDYVFYAWKGVQGYSKFGKYVGNGVAGNGPFVYTGFKPAWIMVKPIDAAIDWFIYDNRRAAGNTVDARYNEVKSALYANSDSAGTGASYTGVDLVSNGFKWINGGSGGPNQSGITYIYMAFAENPFTTSTGAPITAN